MGKICIVLESDSCNSATLAMRPCTLSMASSGVCLDGNLVLNLVKSSYKECKQQFTSSALNSHYLFCSKTNETSST